jgi:hypothetical protein
MDSTKKQARIAGVLYTLVGATAPIGLIYVPGKLFVTGDATATADHIRASESLLRVGVASELLHQSIEVFLVLVLYDLFKGVNKPLARQLAILGLIPIPIVFLNVLNEIAALILASGANFLAVFGRPQLDALAMFFVRLHGQGLQVAAIFWGLWLFPFGLLVIRCMFIPKVLGILLLIAGLGYVLGSFTSLIIPYYTSPLGDVAGILELGEPPIILWLLIWGARAQAANAKLPSVAN